MKSNHEDPGVTETTHKSPDKCCQVVQGVHDRVE